MPDSRLQTLASPNPKASLKIICFSNAPHFSFPSAIDCVAQRQFSWLLSRPNIYESKVVTQVNQGLKQESTVTMYCALWDWECGSMLKCVHA